jgi:hypothetical protein
MDRSCSSDSRTCGDRNPLYGDLASSNSHVNPAGLLPGPAQRLSGSTRVVTTFRLGNSERGKIRFAGQPIGQVASEKPRDPRLLAPVKVHRPTTEMGKDVKTEIALKVSARDKPPEQTRQGDFYLTRLSKWLSKNEGRARSGGREKGV